MTRARDAIRAGLALAVLAWASAARGQDAEEPWPPVALTRMAGELEPFLNWSFDGRSVSWGREGAEAYLRRCSAARRSRLAAAAPRRRKALGARTRPGAPGGALELFMLEAAERMKATKYVDFTRPVMGRLDAQARGKALTVSWSPTNFNFMATVRGGRDSAHISVVCQQNANVFAIASRWSRRLTLWFFADGRVWVKDWRGKEKKRYEAPSFIELILRHRRFMLEDVLPAFESVGFARLMRPFDAAVIRAALNILAPPGAGPSKAEAWRLIAALSSESAKQREQAMARLQESYAYLHDLLEQAYRQSAPRSALRFRLAFLRERFGLEARAAREYVTRARLTERREYLTALVPLVSEEERPRLRAFLAEKKR